MNIEPPLSSPIQVKVDWATDFYARFGDKLLHDPETVNLIKNLESAIGESRSAMSDTGLTLICRRCEVKEGGSCCGAGLENRYGAGLLLINLLLQTTLPQARYDENSCYFLGEKGCLLKARHAICVNYICSKISHELDPVLLGLLREKEGVELEAVFRLNEKIKTLLRKMS